MTLLVNHHQPREPDRGQPTGRDLFPGLALCPVPVPFPAPCLCLPLQTPRLALRKVRARGTVSLSGHCDSLLVVTITVAGIVS